MARNEKGNRVAGASAADGAGYAADGGGELGVAPRLAVRDRRHGVPRALPEGRAGGRQRQRKALQTAGEIRGDLRRGLLDERIAFIFFASVFFAGGRRPAPGHAGDGASGGADAQPSHRGVEKYGAHGALRCRSPASACVSVAGGEQVCPRQT